MSTPKFTPGPWRSDGGHHINAPTPINGLPVPLAHLVIPRGSDIEEQYANARLIAAAPELFEVCQIILDNYLPDSMVEGSWDYESSKLLRAVIAKVDGEQVEIAREMSAPRGWNQIDAGQEA